MHSNGEGGVKLFWSYFSTRN